MEINTRKVLYKTLVDAGLHPSEAVSLLDRYAEVCQTPLRDQFAMAALAGMCSDTEYTESWEAIAKYSYDAADAMIKARSN